MTAGPLLPNNPTSELENPLDEPHFSANNDNIMVILSITKVFF